MRGLSERHEKYLRKQASKMIQWLGWTGIVALLSCAAAALVLMLIRSVGAGILPPEYFSIVERFRVFAAVGFNALLDVYLFHGFRKAGRTEHGYRYQGIN